MLTHLRIIQKKADKIMLYLQVRTFTLTSLYLDLVNLYASMGILLSRVPHRKVILAIELISRSPQKGGIEKVKTLNI